MTVLKATIIEGKWAFAPAPEQDAEWLSRHPEIRFPSLPLSTPRLTKEQMNASRR